MWGSGVKYGGRRDGPWVFLNVSFLYVCLVKISINSLAFILLYYSFYAQLLFFSFSLYEFYLYYLTNDLMEFASSTAGIVSIRSSCKRNFGHFSFLSCLSQPMSIHNSFKAFSSTFLGSDPILFRPFPI